MNKFRELVDQMKELGDTNGCGVIAHAILTGRDYLESAAIMERLGRKLGGSTSYAMTERALELDGLIVVDPTLPATIKQAVCDTYFETVYARQHGYLYAAMARQFENNDCIRYGKTFASLSLPADRNFIVFCRGHIAAVEKGVIQDWTGTGKRNRIVGVFEVTKNQEKE